MSSESRSSTGCGRSVSRIGQLVVEASPAWSSPMMVRRMPEASSPGPSGPDESSPTGGSLRSAALAAADIWPSCQQISSLTASGRSGAASPAAFAAYTAALSARPCGQRLKPERPPGRPPQPRGHAPPEQHGQRRNDGESRRRRQARRVQTLGCGQWRPGGDRHPVLPPRTPPSLALRSPPPTPPRPADQPRSAPAANTRHDSLTPATTQSDRTALRVDERRSPVGAGGCVGGRGLIAKRAVPPAVVVVLLPPVADHDAGLGQ